MTAPYGYSPPALGTMQGSMNGLLFGTGTVYDVLDWTGSGPARAGSGDGPRPRDSGQFLGLDILNQGRDMALKLGATSDSVSLWHATQALDAAFAAGGNVEYPLWWQGRPDAPLLAYMVRVRDAVRNLDQLYAVGGQAITDISLHCTDPRIYGAPQSATVGLGNGSAGASWPWSWPLSWGAGSGASLIQAVNSGNIESRPLLKIVGPCTNPVVANLTAGWALSITNPSQSTYTLYAGDVLLIDTDMKSITYYPGGGTVGTGRKNWLVAGSAWPNSGTFPIAGLAPGTNTLSFQSSDTGTVAGTLTVQYASAYRSGL